MIKILMGVLGGLMFTAGLVLTVFVNHNFMFLATLGIIVLTFMDKKIVSNVRVKSSSIVFVAVILAGLMLKYLLHIHAIPKIITPFFAKDYPEWFQWVTFIFSCAYFYTLAIYYKDAKTVKNVYNNNCK